MAVIMTLPWVGESSDRVADQEVVVGAECKIAAVADFPKGVRGGPRHHSSTAKQ
jgi:hypothetical protein